MVRFGSAGNPDSFYQQGHKSSASMPAYLQNMGLSAYEYQCSRGVNIGEEKARQLGQAAQNHDIRLSIHAPYYINLATEDPQIRENTKRHIYKSLQVARWMGAYLVVFHAGAGKIDRLGGMKRAQILLEEVLTETTAFDDIYLAPETMGKHNQLGNLDEVIELCKMSPRLIPTVDFGHMHAYTLGQFTEKHNFAEVFDRIAKGLGDEVANKFHIHFSPIEFTKAGEKRHWTMLDDFGPPFKPLAEVMAERGFRGTVISETAGRQAEDAVLMKEMWEHEAHSHA